MNRSFAASFILLLLGSSAAAHADAFYVDFGDVLPRVPSSYGAAAQVPGAWNSIATVGIRTPLLEASGSLTPVFITLEAEAANGTTGIDNGFPDGRLLGDNFYSSAEIGWSITVGGLPDGLYDIYYFEPTYHLVSTGEFMVGGRHANALTSDGLNLVPGVTWDAVRNVQVLGGELSMVSVSTVGYRGLAGLQIVAVPEPSLFALFGLGSLLLVSRLARSNQRR